MATKSVFRLLYTELREATFAKRDYEINRDPQTNQPAMFNHVPVAARTHIQERSKSSIKFSCTVGHRNVTILFVTEETSCSERTYKKHADLITAWLHVASKYADASCSTELSIYIYMSSLKKRLPKKKADSIGWDHANSGLTTTCPRVAEIVVYRKEEWFKVFIHETMHSLKMDFSAMDCSKVNAHILSLFKVESKVNLFEAYTEFWAETINVTFCSFSNNRDDIHEFIKDCISNMDAEREHSVAQLAKVLDFMELDYVDLFIEGNRYKEQSSVLSYYVIKTVLMYNYPAFLRWCATNNRKLFVFEQTRENQTEFCSFVEKHYKGKALINAINNAEYDDANLRMSVTSI
jgi:hypothetical protein